MLFEDGDELEFQFLLFGLESLFCESRMVSDGGFGAFAVPVMGLTDRELGKAVPGETVLGDAVLSEPVFGDPVFGELY